MFVYFGQDISESADGPDCVVGSADCERAEKALVVSSQPAGTEEREKMIVSITHIQLHTFVFD